MLKMTAGAIPLLVVLSLCSAGCRDLPTEFNDGDLDFGIVFPVHHESPDWSHDGRIAFRDNGIIRVTDSGGAEIDNKLAGIWIIDTKTGDLEQLVRGGVHPAWSPDCSQIAYSQGQIFSVDVASKRTKRLTTSGWNNSPSWSPDANRIVYESSGQSSRGFGLWIMNRDGENKENISSDAENEWRLPNWSPLGETIAHVRILPSVGFQVFVMDISDGSARRISDSKARSLDPVYSPDGQRVAFETQDLRGGTPKIVIVDVDGTNSTMLGGPACDPAWSPDGTRIVYSNCEWRSNEPENGVLWIIELETKRRRQLTFKRVP